MSAGVVIVGAGLAAQRCCEALRARGYDGPIRVVGDEPHRPYDRPPLSKAVLAGNAEPDTSRCARATGTPSTTSTCCSARPPRASTPRRASCAWPAAPACPTSTW